MPVIKLYRCTMYLASTSLFLENTRGNPTASVYYNTIGAVMALSEINKSRRPRHMEEEEDDYDERVDDVFRDQMSFAYYKYLEGMSNSDRDLSESQRTLIRDSAASHTREICNRHICSQDQLDNSSQLAANLQSLGDRFDAFLNENPRLNDVLESAIEGTDGQPDAESLIHYLSDVVTIVFECDENGQGNNNNHFAVGTCTHNYLSLQAQNINLGRIVVVFCYCYRVCKSFVQRAIDASSLLSFMASLASYFVLTLLKVKFYEWLEQQGGLVRYSTLIEIF